MLHLQLSNILPNEINNKTPAIILLFIINLDCAFTYKLGGILGFPFGFVV
jgi:hypothetical protein